MDRASIDGPVEVQSKIQICCLFHQRAATSRSLSRFLGFHLEESVRFLEMVGRFRRVLDRVSLHHDSMSVSIERPEQLALGRRFADAESLLSEHLIGIQLRPTPSDLIKTQSCVTATSLGSIFIQRSQHSWQTNMPSPSNNSHSN